MRWQNHAASITITRHHSLQYRYFFISMSKQGLYLLSDTTSHTLDAELPIKSQSDVVSLTHMRLLATHFFLSLFAIDYGGPFSQ